jgi:hypothetical protein
VEVQDDQGEDYEKDAGGEQIAPRVSPQPT